MIRDYKVLVFAYSWLFSNVLWGDSNYKFSANAPRSISLSHHHCYFFYFIPRISSNHSGLTRYSVSLPSRLSSLPCHYIHAQARYIAPRHKNSLKAVSHSFILCPLWTHSVRYSAPCAQPGKQDTIPNPTSCLSSSPQSYHTCSFQTYFLHNPTISESNMLPHEQPNSQAKRQSGRTNSRTPSRGGINKSRGRTPRVDRDGDLVMGASAATRGASSNGRGDRHPRRGRGGFHNSKADNMNITLDPKMLQQAIARTANSNRPDRGQRNNPKPSYKGGHGHDTEGLDEISIIGLKDSMAAKNSGGGISELVSWLEHKASKGAKGGDMVRIQKVCF